MGLDSCVRLAVLSIQSQQVLACNYVIRLGKNDAGIAREEHGERSRRWDGIYYYSPSMLRYVKMEELISFRYMW